MAFYEAGTEVMGDWRIVREIGRGASGRVYEADKEGHGFVARSAIKVVSVPSSDSETASMRAEGMSEESIASEFARTADNLLAEVSLLASMSHPGIVHYQDHCIVAHPNDPGCDVLVRMELLEGLVTYMGKGALSQAEVARLGVELADALAFCHTRGIVHRDVKPQNVFLDSSGHFQLGDFGISRAVEGSTGTLTRRGTPPYMAPELILNGRGGPAVDVYSLGLTLYQLLNGNRLPFYPPAPQAITPRDRENAQRRRLLAEPLPPINDCDPRLFALVARACAFDAADRPVAAELAEALRVLRPQLVSTSGTNSASSRGGFAASDPSSGTRTQSQPSSSVSEVSRTIEVSHGYGRDGSSRGTPSPRSGTDPSRGQDLLVEVSVTADEARRGVTVTSDKVFCGGAPIGMSYDVYVPAGTRDGAVLRWSGMGVAGSVGGPSGDLVVKVHVEGGRRRKLLPAVIAACVVVFIGCVLTIVLEVMREDHASKAAASAKATSESKSESTSKAEEPPEWTTILNHELVFNTKWGASLKCRSQENPELKEEEYKLSAGLGSYEAYYGYGNSRYSVEFELTKRFYGDEETSRNTDSEENWVSEMREQAEYYKRYKDYSFQLIDTIRVSNHEAHLYRESYSVGDGDKTSFSYAKYYCIVETAWVLVEFKVDSENCDGEHIIREFLSTCELNNID